MKTSNSVYGVPLVFLLALGYLSFDMGATLDEVHRVEAVRFNSYVIADELRQSSTDLTRLARTFVVTKDKSYESQYLAILDWRSGKSARPATAQLYPGKKISQEEIMRELGFTSSEFELLNQAKNNSNGLVTTETLAMNAVQGLALDGISKYKVGEESADEMARRIMFDAEYHANVKSIMAPIDRFFNMFDARTLSQVKECMSHAQLVSQLIAINLLLLSISIVFVVIVQQRALTSAINTIVARLSTSVRKLIAASGELSKASGTLSQGTTDQASSVEETSASLEEISAMVKNNVSNSEKSVDLTEGVKTKSQRGNESMEELKGAMSKILDSNERIEELVKVIGNIAEKTEIMDEIVLQTKLLSFNASVEAERAGEHGRGFAVVAKEVGNLARLSGVAAEEIAAIVKDSLATAAEITGQNKEHVEKGAAYVQEAAMMLSDILNSVTQVTAGSQQIMVASKEQSEGIGQINIAIDRISRTTQTTSAIANDTSDSAEILEKEVEVLNRTIAELASVVGRRATDRLPQDQLMDAAPQPKVIKPAAKAATAKKAAPSAMPKASGDWESL